MNVLAELSTADPLIVVLVVLGIVALLVIILRGRVG